MKCSNNSSRVSPKKYFPQLQISKSNSRNNIQSPFIIPGKIHKKINYSSKYSLNNFISVNDNNNEIKTIGSGSFGNVYLAKNIKDNKIYAIKYMEKNKLLKILHSLKGIYREIDIQSRIEHENIIRILYTYEDKEGFSLVMPFAQKGNLFHYIRKHRGLSEKQTFQLFIQVVNAVYFLHKNDLIHRDIKPENILLFTPNNNEENNYLVKLCDFGWCVKLDGESRKTFCGTTEYMSPELIEHEIYGKEIDVWSLGILLYEMIHGYSPFRPRKEKFNEKEVFANIKKHKIIFGKKVSERCKKLIINLLAFNKNKRYKVEDIYNSEFVKYYEKKNCFIPQNNIRNENIKIIRSFSREYVYIPKRNYISKIKKISNSFINKIPNNINDFIYTKRDIKNTKRNLKLNSKEKSHSVDKGNIFDFINNTNKKNKNNRNKINININNKIKPIFNVNTENIYKRHKNSYNSTEFNISKRKKSITSVNSAKDSYYKEKKENKKKKINKETNLEKNKQEQDTIKLDLYSGNIIKYILKEFQLNNANYISRKSPDLRKVLFTSEIKNENNNDKNNEQIKIINNTATKRKKNEDKNNKIEDLKIFNINLPKNKSRFNHISKQILKSNSFKAKNEKKKIILTPNNELNSSYEQLSKQKRKEKINIKQKRVSNITNKKFKFNCPTPRSGKMLVNRINNINYQNNNINNFYIINDPNINDIDRDYLEQKEILFKNYIKKAKIIDNKLKEKSSEDSEKSTTPKKNKDNIKINPIKLLGDFHKEYTNLFPNKK